ncbi:MAG: oligosaccharide flippase family protein, partial [Steroidobacteraceae bacterium]
VVGAAVRLVLLNAAACRLMLPTRHLSPAFGYLKFGGVLFADNLLWRWYTSLDTFLLGRWTGTTILGFYSVAQQIAELPLEKISTVVNEVSLPAYAELCGDRTAAAGLMLETMRTHATIGFPVFWGLAVVAPYIVPIVFGPKWALATFPLIALSAIAPLRLIGSIETPAMTGLGRPRVLLKSKLVIAPAMTLGLVLGCRLGGINGAALAWLTAFPICYAIAFRYVMQAAGITHQQIFAVIRGPAAAAALMVALVLLWCRLAAMVSPSPVFGLITSVVAGAILYVGGLRLIDPGAYRLAHSRLGQFVGLRPSQ